jgi:hypothetical protein
MSKNTTPADRIEETIRYISDRYPELGTKLRNEVKGELATEIGTEISLQINAMHMFKDKKNALRAILLCQRYFFKRNRDTWKATSLGHWRTKSQSTINQAIQLFTSSCDDAARLADVAESMGKAPVDKTADARYKLSSARNEQFNIGGETCYTAIFAWLLKSGLVSFQWFLQHSSVTSAEKLRKSMGAHKEIWSGNDQFTDESELPFIPRGHIVHFYDPSHETMGHWMVSLGNTSDRLGVGCNNHVFPGFSGKVYSNCASMNDQFRLQYKQPKQRGVAFVYNPENIPDRKTLNK